MRISIGKFNRAISGWLFSCLATALGILSLFHFFPDLPTVQPAPRPFTPRIRYRMADASRHPGDASELSAVWSPALIALPNGMIHPAFSQNHVSQITPPLEALDDSLLFVERVPAVKRAPYNEEAYQAKAHTEIIIPRLPSSPTSFKEPERPKENSAMIRLSGGLKNASIEGLRFSDNEWIKPGLSWAATFHVRFGADGRPVNVFAESPARDNKLNEELARMIYQCRLNKPAGPGEGQITLWWY